MLRAVQQRLGFPARRRDEAPAREDAVSATPGLAAAAMLAEVQYPWVDPVLVNFPGPVDVRWYGMMYLAGFTVAFFVLRWLARREVLRLDPSAVGDLLFAVAMGVVLGGRLGYLLFYDLSDTLRRPWEALRLWEGGMSFHGGLLGVILAAAWFARKHRMRFLNLGDALALAIPFGIAAVRVANFFNGELYGRVASPHVRWAMRFPTDPVALRLIGADALSLREREQRIAAAYASGEWERVRSLVPLRHPSQLYQALTEGVLLGLVLWGVFGMARRSGYAPPDGMYGGVFLIGYGGLRIVTELFRQPDAQFRGPGDALGTVLGPLTMGQTLSALMVLAGTLVLVWVARRPRDVSHSTDGAHM